MQIVGRRYDTGRLVQLDISEGSISRVVPLPAEPDRTGQCPWVSPGWIDVQVNGYAGPDFNSPEMTAEHVQRIAGAMAAFGVTRFCPTLTTERFEVLRDALRVIVAACESSSELARRIAGIHLEGPYLSREDGARGAHPRQYCRAPDWDEFQRLQEAAAGRIRILTMAVEHEGAPEFIRRVAAGGVLVSIGHTAADSEQIRAAVDAGARMSTHLGNGSHPMIRRHSNYIWDQLGEDRLAASLICDGHHLPPEVVKTFVRAKTPERCVLVSDLVGLAGRPPGRYFSTLCDAEVLPSGKLVIAGQRELLAGASEPLVTGLANVIRFADVSLTEAIRMVVDHPARLLDVDPGGLEPGDRADLVLFDLDEQLQVRATLVAGKVVAGSIPAKKGTGAYTE